MRENGLYPVTLRKFKPYKKGKSDGIYSENVIKRNFSPENPRMASLFPLTPYPALVSVPTGALSSVTAKAYL